MLPSSWAGAALGTRFVVVTGASAPGSGLSGAVALTTDDVWAVGSFRPTGAGYDDAGLDAFTERFTGTSWRQFPLVGVRLFDESLAGVDGTARSDVWAVGQRKRTGFKSPVTTLAYRWNGASWNEVPTPRIDGNRYWFSAVSAVDSDDVWAVGSAAAAPSTALHALVEHWNGSAWSIVPIPLPASEAGSALLGVSAHTSDDVWAVGTLNGHTFAVHWNGIAWAVVTTRDVAPQRPGAMVQDKLTAVTALATNDVWAVGTAIDTLDGRFLPYRTVVEHWNGVRWDLSSAPSPTGHPQLTGVAATGAADVWAVGFGWSDRATGAPIERPILLHLDAGGWTSVAPPSNVGGGDNELRAVTGLSTGDVWAVGGSPLGALIERRS
jgi:hypothetical protein